MDEKLKLAIDKLLTTYGVEDEESRKSFLQDIEQELGGAEEVEVEKETTEIEEEKVEENPALDGKEEETVKVEEETEMTDETELPPEEGQVEEQPTQDDKVYESKLREYEETIKALVGRIDHLEEIVSKLGKPVGDEKQVGFDTEKKETTQEEEIDERERVYRKALGY